MARVVVRVVTSYYPARKIDLNEVGRCDLLKKQPKGIDQILIWLSRDPGTQVRENEIGPTVFNEEPIAGGEILTQRPLFG